MENLDLSIILNFGWQMIVGQIQKVAENTPVQHK